MNWRQYLGYDWKDNVLTGAIVGILSILLGFYIQVRIFSLEALWHFADNFIAPVGKLSILCILPACLFFNYFDKLYSFRGALAVLLISVLIFMAKFVF